MDSQDQNQNLNLELLNDAINKLIEARNNKPTSSDGDGDADSDDQLLLSRLLAQLESLKEQQQVNVDEDVEKQEIMREIKKIKRQNVVTHWLLSVLIVLTVAWQISEVSLILKVRQGLSDPFKHLGGFFTRMLRRPLYAPENGKDDATKADNAEATPPIPLPVPPLNIPCLELPDLINSGDIH